MEMQGTLDSSVESRPKVCRLCFSVNISFSELSSDLRDVIQIILPNVDLEKCTTDSVLCEECDKIVQELFAFKSMCCEIEDTIHNYTNGGQIQVDLEKITGVVQLDIMYDEEGRRWKICRTCLDLTDPSSTLEISKSENRDLCADLTAYLPEVDISLTMSPVICLNCTKLVRTYATYSTKCMANETELTSYFEKLPPEAHTDLYSLLQKCKEGFPSKINLKKENSGSNHKDAMPNLDSESSRTTDVLAAPHANSDSEGDADDPMPELDPAVDSDSGHSYSNVRISTKAGPRNSKIAIEEISMSDVSVFEQTSKSNVNDVGSASSNNSGNNSDAPVSEQASKSDGSNDGSGSSSSVSRNYSETGSKDDAMLSSNNLNDTPYNTRKRKYKKIVDDDKDVFEDDTGKDPDFIMDELDEMDYDPDNFEDDDDEDSDQTYMPSENSKSRERQIAADELSTETDKVPIKGVITLFKCLSCLYQVADESEFEKHNCVKKRASVRNDFGHKYECRYCTLRSYTRLPVHYRQHVQLQDFMQYTCRICERQYQKISEVRCHSISTCLVYYKCQTCTYFSPHLNRFMKHLKNHDDSGIVSWWYCNYCFKEVSHTKDLGIWKVHSHAGPTKLEIYSCQKCPYYDKSVSQIRRHMSLAHVREETRTKNNDLCPLCLVYCDANTVLLHIQKRHFSCELCPYNTLVKRLFKKHLLVHEYSKTNKVHKCHMCSALFKKRRTLVEHISVDHTNLEECAVLQRSKYTKRFSKNKMVQKSQEIDNEGNEAT